MGFKQPLPGARSSHQHLPPSMKHAWWTWVCPSCDPAAHAAFTADTDHGFPDVAEVAAECPLCLGDAKVLKGRLRRHSDDSADCRASGLSPAVAEHLLGALLRGISAARFVEEAAAAGRVPRKAAAVATGSAIPAQLAQLRRDCGITLQEVADWGSLSVGAIHGWEKGNHPPRVDSAVKWASVFHLRLLIVEGDSHAEVTSATASAWFLESKREGLGMSAAVVAQHAGFDQETMRRWEVGKSSAAMTLSQLGAWCVALGMELALESPLTSFAERATVDA